LIGRGAVIFPILFFKYIHVVESMMSRWLLKTQFRLDMPD
jgi:hypothetical protein